jgi:hypothetical protein
MPTPKPESSRRSPPGLRNGPRGQTGLKRTPLQTEARHAESRAPKRPADPAGRLTPRCRTVAPSRNGDSPSWSQPRARGGLAIAITMPPHCQGDKGRNRITCGSGTEPQFERRDVVACPTLKEPIGHPLPINNWVASSPKSTPTANVNPWSIGRFSAGSSPRCAQYSLHVVQSPRCAAPLQSCRVAGLKLFRSRRR